MLIRTVIVVFAFVLAVGGIDFCVWLHFRKSERPRRRADPVQIAVLEWEIFGIQPEPGTTAAAAIGMKQAFGTPASDHRGGHASSSATVDHLPPLPIWLTHALAEKQTASEGRPGAAQS